MSNKEIHVLNQETINKIAAGEVIERPSSVVKELMENSIDAGADSITVEIKEGGIRLIRITDNGSGIYRGEIPKAFLRHATSKITSSDDLLTIASLGFRGEALSSVAAVSCVELITRPKEEPVGCRYTIEGGVEKSCEDMGTPAGTTILVHNLFDHTPVRKKFLKSPQTEGSYVGDVVEKIALSHPEVSIRLINSGQNKLFTTGNGNRKDLIYSVFGREIASNLLEVRHEEGFIKIEGYIGKPVITRGNRDMENYFINGRYIKNKVVTRAIEDAFKSYLMQHRYPFTVLYLTIDSAYLDVNVHPTKMELRISHEEQAYRSVYNAVLNALSGKEFIPEVSVEKESDQKPVSNPAIVTPIARTEPFEQKRKEISAAVSAGPAVQPASPFKSSAPVTQTATVEEPVLQKTTATVEEPVLPKTTATVEKPVLQKTTTAQATVSTKNTAPTVPSVSNISTAPKEPTVMKEEQVYYQPQIEELPEMKVIREEARPDYHLIGQVFLTYWIFEYQQKMYILDQHAAHEKVLFEKNLKEISQRAVYSQNLFPPKMLTLTTRQIDVFRQIHTGLADAGYDIEEFGGKEYIVKAIPASLPDLDVFDFLTQLLDSYVSDDVNSLAVNHILYDRIALMSCKAAVKGNRNLSFDEANALLDQLLKLENPYQCPHGRPTMISISREELEKKFKRIV